VLGVMRAAGAGLAAAHAAGLVHRDFKPENVIVGKDGRVRVMDFGLARLEVEAGEAGSAELALKIESKSPLSDRLTETGAMMGTPAYMAPELYQRREADARSDQFAFGVALYEALYRERPFDRDALMTSTARPPKPPAATKVPAHVARVVLRALELEPSKRFATMDALLDELARDPSATRRRVAASGAALFLCGAAVVGFAFRGGETASPRTELCTGASGAVAAAWSPASRKALEAAFGKHDDAVRGTEHELDTYAAGWVAMRTEACEATRVRGEQSEEVLDLRMACLDNRLVEMKKLVELFASANDKLVTNAVDSVKRLSPLADCADVVALRAPDPLPKDPTARAKVFAAQAKLAETKSLQNASKLKEALELVDGMADSTKQLAHPPTEADLHLRRGKLQLLLQKGDGGEQELLAAVAAADAGKADKIRIQALITLVQLAERKAQVDLGLERARYAEAALARIGGQVQLKFRLLLAEGNLYAGQGSFDKALAVAHEARELAERTPNRDNLFEYAFALSLEANVLDALGRSDEAVELFRKELAYNEANHEVGDSAGTLHNMALAELSLGRSADAAEHAKRAVEIKEKVYGPDSPPVAASLRVLGDALRLQHDPKAALPLQERAAKIVTATLGEQDLQNALMLESLARTLVELKRYDEAAHAIERAQAIAVAKLGGANPDAIAYELSKCIVQREAGQAAAAVTTCKHALAGFTKAAPGNLQAFGFLSATAKALLAAKQPREASELLQRALAMGSKDASELHVVELLAAQALWDSTGDHAHAIELARKARDGFAALGAKSADDLHEAEAWLTAHAK